MAQFAGVRLAYDPLYTVWFLADRAGTPGLLTEGRKQTVKDGTAYSCAGLGGLTPFVVLPG